MKRPIWAQRHPCRFFRPLQSVWDSRRDGFVYPSEFIVASFTWRWGPTKYQGWLPTVLGCWITRVGVRCYVGCWKPNDLTRVGLILTCWNSNACWTENVSVIVRFKDVLFCSMLDTCVFEPLRRCQTIAMQTSLSRRSAG